MALLAQNKFRLLIRLVENLFLRRSLVAKYLSMQTKGNPPYTYKLYKINLESSWAVSRNIGLFIDIIDSS